MMTDRYEGRDGDLAMLFDAMRAARARFEEVIEKAGFDPAFWKLEMTGWVLDVNFEKWKELKFREEDS